MGLMVIATFTTFLYPSSTTHLIQLHSILLTYTDFEQLLNYYYKFGLITIQRYHPFDSLSVKQFDEDIMSPWKSTSGFIPKVITFSITFV